MWLSLGVLLAFFVSLLQATVNVGNISEMIEKRLTEIEKQNALFLRRNKKLQSKLNAFEVKIYKMNIENKELNKRVNVLSEQNGRLEKQFFILKNNSCVCRVQSKGIRFNSYVESDNRQIFEQASRQSGVSLPEEKRTKRKVNKKRLGPAPVAFHARMAKSLSNPGDNQHIEFTDVVTNVGNGYNGPTGTFICPTAGTYVFFATILTYPNKHLDAAITVNGKSLGYVYNSRNTDYTSASNMIVVNLQENDRVWMRVLNENGRDDGNVVDSTWSDFSGYILWQSQ